MHRIGNRVDLDVIIVYPAESAARKVPCCRRAGVVLLGALEADKIVALTEDRGGKLPFQIKPRYTCKVNA